MTLRQQIAVTTGDSFLLAANALYEAGFDQPYDVHVQPVPTALAAQLLGAIELRMRKLEGAGNLAVWFDESTGRFQLQLPPTVLQPTIDELLAPLQGTSVQADLHREAFGEDPIDPFACSFPNCDRPLRSGTGIGSSLSSTCSGGFFAKSSKYRYFVTAGHCRTSTTKGTTWYAKSPTYYNHDTNSRSWPIGKNITSLTSYGPYDFMSVRINSGSLWWANTPGGYYDQRRVSAMGEYVTTRLPQVGEPTCRYGISSNYSCGNVLATNLTTFVGDVAVSGLFSTNLCGTPGDSGGPFLASGPAVLGILSGGANQCAGSPGPPSSGYTVAMQAQTILSATGLKLVASR
ncbi:MAG: S1 family peptidase [Solirubrobacterales bacterium]